LAPSSSGSKINYKSLFIRPLLFITVATAFDVSIDPIDAFRQLDVIRIDLFATISNLDLPTR
jgi:hypothetical protein